MLARSSQPGKVYLVGAGPGDPDLLTLKAARILGQCDVVLYDRLVSDGVLALADPQAVLIYVGKHEGEQEHTQGKIFDLILEHASAGKTVVRLKGGDPLVFGRGGEEWQRALDHGLTVELIPGVSSAVSLPGLAGIPLTYRDVSQGFAVVTGHCRDGLVQDWRRYVGVDTLVLLMSIKNRSFIAQSLIAAGRNPTEPVAFIERGATPQQRVVESTLKAVADGKTEIHNPAVWVIGEVVRLRLNAEQAAKRQALLREQECPS